MSVLSGVARFFNAQKSVLELQLEVNALRKENASLKEKSDSMRRGMRRCVSCEYRLDFKERQGKAPILDSKAAKAAE